MNPPAEAVETPDPASVPGPGRAGRRRLPAIPGLEFVLVGATLAVLWGAIALHLGTERAALLGDAGQTASNLAAVAGEGIARTVETIDQRLLFLREAYRREPDTFSLAFLSPMGDTRRGGGEEVMQVALIDAEGRLAQSNLGPTDGRLDLSDRPHFRLHRDRPEDVLRISPPLLGRVSGRWSVQFTRRLSTPGGAFAGVLVASLDPHGIVRFQERLDLSGAMTVLGTDGIVRAAAPDDAPLGQDLSTTPVGRAAREAGCRRLAPEETPGQRIGVCRLERHPVAVAVAVDLAPALAAFHARLLRMALGGAGLSLLVAAGGWLLVRRRGRLVASRAVLRDALENIGQGLVMVDAAGRVSLLNSRYVSLLGLPPDLARPGADYAALIRWQAAQGEFGPRHRDTPAAELLASLAVVAEPGLRLKERVRPDGTVLEIRLREMPGGGMIGTFTDITARREIEAEANRLAFHDGLTDLANRALLEERLGQAIAQSGRRGESLAVLWLDLDRFKAVNDGFGHAVADELLRQVAARLRGIVRASDIASRVGGDEFVLVQTGVSQPTDIAALAGRVRAEITQAYALQGQFVAIDVSIGIAVFPDDGAAGEALLHHAAAAVHRAKEAGGGATCFFEPEMGARLQARGQLERDLRLALERGGIEVHFQSQHAAETRRIVAQEALLRWNHPVRGPVSPAEFVPLAEECGLILPLGHWVLERACAAAVSWPEPWRVAVNLSPVQFRRGDLAGTVAEVLAATGLPAHRLELEVTEGVLIEDAAGTRAIIQALKAMGVRLALDDFGIGYSSLGYLRRFPFDRLKIDRSFIQALGTDPSAEGIVTAILAMGRSLGLRVTAEGVETEEQLALLRRHGCEEVQGFLLGRPIPEARLPRRGAEPAPAA